VKASGCEVELSRNRFTNQEAFVSHANAALTPITRLRLARLVVDGRWTYSAAATMFMVSPRTAKKWAERYRIEGTAGMTDRSSRPHHSPTRTPTSLVRAIVALRWRHRLGPVQIGGRLGLPASTVHAVLVRCRVNRLSRIDRVTGEPLRRYEHEYAELAERSLTWSGRSTLAGRLSLAESRLTAASLSGVRAQGAGLDSKTSCRSWGSSTKVQ
jgi:leucine-zipper of insertion element IS481